MNAPTSTRVFFRGLCGIVTVLMACAGIAAAPVDEPGAGTREGQRDFDVEIGHWKTTVRRLQQPLRDSNVWVDYQGTTVVRQLLGGLANIAELDIAGSAGRIQGVSLRLYNPQTRQWSLNFSNLRAGTLTAPTIGAFKNGRGEFIAHETLDGRAILVRFVMECATSDTCHFEQAFSSDDGKTWEPNWIADDTRIPGPKD